jgi:hypothetical protein
VAHTEYQKGYYTRVGRPTRAKRARPADVGSNGGTESAAPVVAVPDLTDPTALAVEATIKGSVEVNGRVAVWKNHTTPPYLRGTAPAIDIPDLTGPTAKPIARPQGWVG